MGAIRDHLGAGEDLTGKIQRRADARRDSDDADNDDPDDGSRRFARGER